jgi:hypothetical protein
MMAATALAPVEVAATKTATSLAFFLDHAYSQCILLFVNIKKFKCFLALSAGDVWLFVVQKREEGIWN